MSTDNIVRFPDFAPANDAPTSTEAPASHTGFVAGSFARFLLGFARAVLGSVRLALFFVLNWLRGPISLTLGLLSGLGLALAPIVWIFWAVPDEKKWTLVGPLLVMGFVASVLRYVFERVLLALEPGSFTEH